jgi:short-subunit dehydrogenase
MFKKIPLPPQPRHIVITGASSGLGAALAVHYAQKGVRLYLGGRNAIRLQMVADACLAKGAEVFIHTVDIKNAHGVNEWLATLQATEPFDLIIANAGISGGTAEGLEGIQQITDIFRTNIEGVANTLAPVIPAMQQAKKGQLALISSLAGFRGFPGAPAYCASKAAVKVYGEALRGLLRPDGIRVSVVCPGYIKTPMTDTNTFKMPLMIPADKAARYIADGLAKNRPLIAFPSLLYVIVWMLMVLPARLVDWLLAGLPRKK